MASFSGETCLPSADNLLSPGVLPFLNPEFSGDFCYEKRKKMHGGIELSTSGLLIFISKRQLHLKLLVIWMFDGNI
jgi:hypothetical protein